MHEFLKKLKSRYLMEAVISILAGLVFAILPDWSVSVLGYLVGAVLLTYGVVLLINGAMTSQTPILTLAVILIVVGVVAFFFTQQLLDILFWIFGIFIAVRAAFYLKKSLDLKEIGERHWWVHFILACVLLLVGFYVMFDPFQFRRAVVIVMGISLIVDGIEGIVVYCRLHAAVKNAKDAMKNNDRIYVDSEEPKDS